jgi:hypothetical protein
MPFSPRKAIPLLLLAVLSNSAMADWVKVGSSRTETLYVDPSTIRATDNVARMWALNDFVALQRVDKRQPFKSEKMEYEYDCKSEKSRLLYFSSHPESMAEGAALDFNVAPGAWTAHLPGSGLEILWKIACGKA